MRAVIFKGPKSVALEDRPVPTIQDPTDAILKVRYAALCGSDLHFYRGHQQVPTGFIVGHEFTGFVTELGSAVKGLNAGDEVVVPFSTACGECFFCEKKQASRCTKGLLFGRLSLQTMPEAAANIFSKETAQGPILLMAVKLNMLEFHSPAQLS